jgi:hypothetical protein
MDKKFKTKEDLMAFLLKNWNTTKPIKIYKSTFSGNYWADEVEE